jgi:hypothetical protein
MSAISATVTTKGTFDVVDLVVFGAIALDEAQDELEEGVGLDLGVLGQGLRGQKKGRKAGADQLLGGDHQAGDLEGEEGSKHLFSGLDREKVR